VEKHSSLGGGIVLIKVVPNPILIFYLSFLKMLVCVEVDCVYSESFICFVLCVWGWWGGVDVSIG
jgi:hypothetical protein